MNMPNLLLPLSAALLGWGLDSGAAGITGRVTLRGVPPPEVRIPMTADCAQAQANTPTTRHYVANREGGLANVFVVIRAGLQGKTFAPPTNVVTMETIACQLHPYVVAARTGQAIQFQNNSSFLENLHFTPRLNGERNYALGPKNTSLSTSFDLAEDFIRIKGDAHPWFFGYVCVVDHPYFAVTGADGKFQLPDGLPDGEYTLEARHLKAGSVKKEIIVRNGIAEPIELTLDAR
jgi:hypothetical protein